MKDLKQKSKELLANYDKPTPVRWRRVGDGLLLVSGIAALFIPGAKWVIITGLIGKFLTNTKY